MESLASRRIILHCSDTKADPFLDVETVRRWHVNGNGWRDVGYHFVIKVDGTIEVGRPLSMKGAHTKGHNDSIGVCYIGGKSNQGHPKDTMTPQQEVAFENLVLSLRCLFGDLTLHGHNEYSNKRCPCFDVSEKFDYLEPHGLTT